MEAREKLSSISDGLKVLQDGCAGRVSRVINLKRNLNFVNVSFTVRSTAKIC